jgi:mRNA interferase RelE/StbE
LHPALKRQVRAALAQIVANPGAGKPLIRELTGLWSFRVGRWRIVYRIAADRIVELVAVGPRRTIYELTLRLISRAR